MDADGIYRMSGIEYTYEELCDAVLAEAATFRRRRGEAASST
jgi:hypothetical protein